MTTTMTSISLDALDRAQAAALDARAICWAMIAATERHTLDEEERGHVDRLSRRLQDTVEEIHEALNAKPEGPDGAT